MLSAPRPASRITAAAILAAASASQAQSCLWSFFPRPTAAHTPFVYQALAVYHAGLQRVLWIQTGGGVPAAQTWSWNGAAWTLLDSAGPTPRQYSAVAYDSDRDRLVLFSGQLDSGVITADTWEWDRTAWTHVPVMGPAARYGHAMAYDAAHHQTVLFSGQTPVTLASDTWVYDGSAWTQAAATGPAPSTHAQMAYDSVRGRVMLADGSIYEWDGSVWTSHGGSDGAWMVFDPARSSLILGSGGYSSRTFEFMTPSGPWTLRDPGAGPDGNAAFDPLRGRAVLITTTRTLEFDPAASIAAPVITGSGTNGPFNLGSPINLSLAAVGTHLQYRWYRDSQLLSDNDRISGATTPALTITDAQPSDAGTYTGEAYNACGGASVLADVSFGPPACYANCDHSTISPFLNVNDFLCFQQRFVAGDPYADCDRDSLPPILSVNDFICFMARFAAGCSAP